MKRILSTLLAMVMLFGAVAVLIPVSTVRVHAAELDSDMGNKTPTYIAATNEALKNSYTSIEQKLFGTPIKENGVVTGYDDTTKDPRMQLALTVNSAAGDVYQLYCNTFTGEVVYYNKTTGNAISTNPYDVGANTNISDAVKAQLLSQVVVSYKGTDGNMKYMYSFTEAAQRGQIQVKTIKNGIRVQYSIGRENATYLMPGWITEARFEEQIIAPFEAYKQEIIDMYGEFSEEYELFNFHYQKMLSGYAKQDPNGLAEDDPVLLTMNKNFPITAKTDDSTGKKYVIYTVASTLTDAQKSAFETLVKTYCPDYGYDELNKDTLETGYVANSETPPLFKLSLEYTLNPQDGSLDIRLPSNGIIYDETLFELEYISTLNYLGAGRMDTVTYDDYTFKTMGAVYGGNAADEMLYDGYVFYPDGSGALFEYNDLYTDTQKTSISWTGKVYGQDYAYYTVSGQHQETIRLPVYGVVGTTDVIEVPMTDGQGNQLFTDSGAKLYDLVPVKSGFLAILEEGDALTSLSVSFGATRHNYASAYPTYYPRPKDTYDLADSVSVSGNTEWTVVADRKYTGSYRTRIQLLDNENANWVGMATAYRNYLEGNGTLERLTETASQIPLYLEAFGTIKTTKQILSFPVEINVPLTSFDDIGAIYDDLSGIGIKNVNFKLTGFANGGMSAKYPAKLKWEKAAGGKGGFRDLIERAETEGFGVYPEFDFAYLSNDSMGDGISLKDAGARTVDNRYCSKQIYDAVYQQFSSYFDMCVATNVMSKYFDKLSSKLEDYKEDGTFGVSVSTLGSDLNSNFDKDNPINREEAKNDVANLLESIKESYSSLMVSGGNRYSLPYADHVLGIPLGSSNYRYASASVPFMAMVLHGYVNYAGSAINMSGDTEYTMLKSIENGAYPYFLLSYNTENTMLMKKDPALSKYFSIRYDIWRWKDPDAKEGKGTIVEQYETINAALADLQTAVMVNHEFVRGERILKDYELEANKELLVEAVLAGVRLQLEEEKAALYATLKTNRDLYLAAEVLDDDLCRIIEELEAGLYDPTDAGLTPEEIAEGAKETAISEIAALLRAKSIRDADLHRLVFDNYYTGDGLEDMHVLLGLNGKINVEVEAMKAAAELAVRNNLNATELAVLKADIEELVEEISDNLTLNLYTELGAILGDKPTDADVALFNKMIYGDFNDAKITAMAGGLSVTLDATKTADLVAFVKECRADGVLLAVADSLTVDYNFNETSSEATDGTDYVDTDYTLRDERLVMVTYKKADGSIVRFILNYNLFDVTIRLDGEPYTIKSYNFKRIDPVNPMGGEG